MENLMSAFTLLAIIVFCVSVIAFPVGLLIAIISKTKRQLGVKIMIISAISAIIGFGICTATVVNQS